MKIILEPLEINCHACRGHGELACPDCLGTGTTELLLPCSACQGQGYSCCPRCEGRGLID